MKICAGAEPNYSRGLKMSRRELIAVLAGGVVASVQARCSPPSAGSRVTLNAPLHYASLSDVAKMVAAREVSPVELTKMMLERIESLDAQLHSYLNVMSESALQAASVAEEEIQSGNYHGPLHGIPIAVKDVFYTRGVPTTGGLAVLSDFVPDFDATVVSRLKAAGAVILGKLNLTEGALAGYHPDFKIPINPWDESLSTSGSSSGSGVASAAGLCYASLGTDTGGSIRFPSMANGVVGLKPTYGHVSRRGVLALASSLDHVGLMTRRATDAAIMLQAIAGFDPDDPTSLSTPVPDLVEALEGGVSGTRIGFDRIYATSGIDAGLVESIEAALGVLEGLGAEIVDVEMPPFSAALAEAYGIIVAFEAVEAHAKTYPSRADEYGMFFRDFLEFGSSVSETAYAAARLLRAEFSDRFSDALSTVDAVACPAGGVPSSASGDVGYGSVAFYESLGKDPWLRALSFTVPANFAGTPSITLPCGANQDGAPYSIQFMGSRLSEALLCRIAHTYEEATEWHSRHPPV